MPSVPGSFEVPDCMRLSYNLHVQCDVGALAGNLRVKVPVTVVAPKDPSLPSPGEHLSYLIVYFNFILINTFV